VNACRWHGDLRHHGDICHQVANRRGADVGQALRLCQVRREAWSAMFVTAGFADAGFPMDVNSAPPGSSRRAGPAAPAIATAALANWPWRRAALLLTGDAQLTSVSPLVGADPIAASRSSLLAGAPAPLAAGATSALAPGDLAAAVAGIAVLVAGIGGQPTHTGLFFVPVALAAGAVGLRPEQGASAQEGASTWTRHLTGLPDVQAGPRPFGDGQFNGPFMLRRTPDSRTSLPPRSVAATLPDQVGRASRREDPVRDRTGPCSA
jgi:hypothetical protein